ncbi:ankyrin repeat domain-containing protein 50-like [Mytilus trossulus]|uniref:ankyrin repeat domain-containing protein 50-like n=1 Tax=Mytilus trossulus TaxID=6551 RepID=UPI0030073598
MLQDVFGKCGLNSGTSKDSIGKAFRTLEGTYVSKQNGIYTVSHDTFFDFLVYYFGQKMCQCLIEHGNSNLIRERFKWGKSTKFGNIEFITVIPDHHTLKLFMDRLIRDWIEGKVSNVFHNINLQFTDFRVQFVQYLEQLDKHYQVKLANRKDTMCLEGDCSSGTYPLIDVCYHGYDDLLQWLLNNSVDVNKSRDDGVTPLIMASCYGILETVIKLLKQNPDVNLCNVENVTALYIACQNSHILVVEQLLKIEDINVDFCNNHGQSPLFIACQRGLTAIVNNLLQKSPNVNQCSPFGLNPLHIACFLWYTDVVSLLLAAKNVNIDVNARDADGSTPLVFACFKNYTEISSLLISAGADVNIKAFSGASALCFAIGHGNIETTSLLLENSASLQTGFKNREQVMDALSQNSERTLNEVQEEIRHFCVTYASQRVRDYVREMSGEYCLDAMIDSSPLHIACFMGHTNIVECLLNLEAYIDFTKEDGTTPLFFASELGHAEIVRLLLDKRANVTIRRQDGKSALDIAEYNGHQSIVAMLMDIGAD